VRRARVLDDPRQHVRRQALVSVLPVPRAWLHEDEVRQVAGAKMESKIKLAWKQGFIAALALFSELSEERISLLAEEAWQARERFIAGITHRDGWQEP